MHWGAAVAALVAATFIFGLAPVSADHPQDPQANGTAVAFDHVGGNEWWVEARVTGDQPFDAVAARDEGGSWVGLEKKSWGVWAASFHIEPGHDVRFRAVDTASGERTRSCWFTHPEGVEQCDGGSEPDPPATDVAFDHKGGNEWWVQARVTGDPSRVQAMDTGGAWKELQLKSWGDWAASFHIEPGHDVRFRALVDGAWQTSCWFTHPGGKTPTGGEVCGPTGGETPPDSGEFDARFEPKPGNEWWVEVFVEANEPLAGVDARDDGGAWIALEKKSWGAWAKSFHVADGSIVEFRARSADGDTDISGGYRWPEATPAEEPAPSDTDVAFGPKAGNEWWVETYAVSAVTISGVEARADGGAWHRLSLRDWGTWAASFHVPAGSEVEFRATTSTGRDVSDAFLWPQADLVDGDGSWPEEGSYAYYRMYDDPPGGYHANGWATDIYHDGVWWRMHEWEEGYEDDTEHHEEFSTHECKSYGPTGPVEPGQNIFITSPCSDDERNATVRNMEDMPMRIEGDQTTIDVWYASDRDPCNCVEWAVRWDDDFGLVTQSILSGRAASGYELRDTDAPLQ